jgi:hypothetical protein
MTSAVSEDDPILIMVCAFILEQMKKNKGINNNAKTHKTLKKVFMILVLWFAHTLSAFMPKFIYF